MTKTERLHRKVILAALVLLCFWVSLSSIRNFYMNTVPPAEVGDCLSLRYPRDKKEYIAVVQMNDSDTKMSTLSIREIGEIHSSDVEYTYGQIRSLKAEKVKCK